MKSIVITGGSRGIGKALATHYARFGYALFLIARNEETLVQTADEIAAKFGVPVRSFACDVANAQKLRDIIEEAFATSEPEIIFANAGISAGTLAGNEPDAQVNKLVATNVHGVLNVLNPALECFEIAKTRGRIAVISSVASYFALPSAPTYCATKAFVRFYATSLGSLYKNHPRVKVTTICPGYIKTDMTAVNSFKMPFLMQPERAAELIAKAVARGKILYIFPWQMRLVVGFVSIFDSIFDVLLVTPLISKILSRLPKKS